MHTVAMSAAVRRLSSEDERRSGFVVGFQALRRLLLRRHFPSQCTGRCRPDPAPQISDGERLLQREAAYRPSLNFSPKA